ncbi:hypothetical protein [Massilia sp. METH4]|uniref:hypothetical protein n=1 Tax=Massilia sp. METH4 TaxID=3123041 RepID=UPI0030D25C0C
MDDMLGFMLFGSASMLAITVVIYRGLPSHMKKSKAFWKGVDLFNSFLGLVSLVTLIAGVWFSSSQIQAKTNEFLAKGTRQSIASTTLALERRYCGTGSQPGSAVCPFIDQVKTSLLAAPFEASPLLAALDKQSRR